MGVITMGVGPHQPLLCVGPLPARRQLGLKSLALLAALVKLRLLAEATGGESMSQMRQFHRYTKICRIEKRKICCQMKICEKRGTNGTGELYHDYGRDEICISKYARK